MEPLASALQRYRQKRVTIMGLGSFGGSIGLAKFLCQAGAHVTITDLKPAEVLQDSIRQLSGYPVTFVLGEHREEDFSSPDYLFISPAIPEDSPYLALARAAGVPIDTEMNLFFRLCPGTIVGITGSHGKTTTTSLTGALVKHVYPRTWVGGNIGRSLLLDLDKIRQDDLVILELSSFQLEDLQAMEQSPPIAALLNIFPNHLDRHRSMENYIEAKMGIFRYQRPEDRAIINADNPILRTLTSRIPGRQIYFSVEKPLDRGVYVEGNWLVSTLGKQKERVCTLEDIPLLGRHNIANVAAAIAIAQTCGVAEATMRPIIQNFTPVPHRLELVAVREGVRFYNDSIATTPQATLAALEAFSEPILLIAGGYDKGIPFDRLGRVIARRVKEAFLIGKSASHIARAIEEGKKEVGGESTAEITFCPDLPAAVQQAWKKAKPGDIVLLSPACASYDQFQNFMERGDLFKRIVQQLGTRG
ncbi:MAG: UDP-N-acetylmuramoyl-L-alanine--D-glutamate ligase [Nitrospinota bacterium]|nr:MAG: UDP-N-acetylmuramoyl-L-alanine--D-glutamate ligase [Nitrospinota bacterium]